MSGSVAPVNLVAATLIAQFSLVLIAFLAVLVLQSGDVPVPYKSRAATSVGLHLITLAAALATIGPLVFSDEYSATWRPLFGASSQAGFPWSLALGAVFVIDIVWITVLVRMTGGSQTSPFGPVYFLLPALAIFLREPLPRVVFYVTVIGISFTFNVFAVTEAGEARGGTRRTPAYIFVSLACLVLAAYVGTITGPR